MMSTYEPLLSPQIRYLINRGIKITNPTTVEIGPEVKLDAISPEGVEINGPVRISGESTSIGPGAKIGTEGPATIINCQLGAGVELGGGFFTSSVFLNQARLGLGAHVREACLIEEQAGGAHCVGLKHTILFPFVTLGSLINFCDCLMAGGTSRKNHSEVGSSFIHFNFTPNQDKATASLLGDVPRGVMLHEPPIFLGGQGGIVGPVRLGYGTVTKAGAIVRCDAPEGGNLLGNLPVGEAKKPYHQGLYLDLSRRIENNLIYLANILALLAWYRYVRKEFLTDRWGRALFEGALQALGRIVEERRYRLGELAGKMETCRNLAARVLENPQREILISQAKEFEEKWPLLEKVFTSGLEDELGKENRGLFLERLKNSKTGDYICTIKSLDLATRALGTRWLTEIVDGIRERALHLIPTCRS